MRQTPLHDFHLKHHARLVDFAGWQMPIQYTSIIDEHKNTRANATLFDVSHMGQIQVTGPDSRAYLDRLLPNDISTLTDGRILYSPLCHENGGTIDDLLVHQISPDNYLLCVNASNTDKDFAHLQQHTAGTSTTVTNCSDDYALLALQGPLSTAILQPLTTFPLNTLKYYHFTETRVANIPLLLARTGYTGEDGFELYHHPKDAPALANLLLDAGAPHNLTLAGLGARDSLRLEAGFPLYGHELSDTISPIAGNISWTVKLTKQSPFIGRDALLAERQNGSPQKILYFKTNDRRIIRPGTPITTTGGSTVGTTTSGTFSPILNESIGSALIDTPAHNQPLYADIRGTQLQLTPVKPPFVQLKKSAS